MQKRRDGIMKRCCRALAKFVIGLGLMATVHSVAPAQEPAEKDAAVEAAAAMRTATLRVLDAGGQPVAGASAAFQIGWPRVKQTEPTDESGSVSVEIPADEPILAVVAWKDGLGL